MSRLIDRLNMALIVLTGPLNFIINKQTKSQTSLQSGQISLITSELPVLEC